MRARTRTITILAVAALTVASSTLAWSETKEPADPRLDQKVTYQAKGQLLHKVLEELSEKTGVEMLCGVNARNWQVRDRKVTI